MTNNEIIKFLQSKQIPQCGDKEYTADEEYEAYQRAIDALEQQPCDDTISRQAALNSLIDNTYLDGYDLAEALDAIENKEKLPPVTPQQKYGKWIRWYEVIESADGRSTNHIPHCKCSECGKEYDPHSSQFIKYCSECGAKMQEREE